MKLTEDSHPEVRRVAVQGVCRVLLSYWEMVPVDKATILLNALLTKAGKSDADHKPALKGVLNFELCCTFVVASQRQGVSRCARRGA